MVHVPTMRRVRSNRHGPSSPGTIKLTHYHRLSWVFVVHLVHNERTKLTATWFNALATALVAAGVFAPAVALLYGLSQARVNPAFMISLALGCLGFGIGLHVVGRRLLGRLQE